MDSLQDLFNDVRGLQIVTLTLIWSQWDWSVGKVLFVPTRYIPFIIIPITLFSNFTVNSDVHTCKVALYSLVALDAVAITLSEVIFSFRVYAMWNRDRAVLVISCCTAIVSLVALIFIFQSFLPSVTFGEPPLSIISGCYKTGANSVIFASFVVIMGAEAVTTALTLYRAFRHFRHTPNALIRNMTRDGVFYCLSMFIMSVANVLVIFLLPIQYSELLSTYQSVMHTILATRMQLQLRKVDRRRYFADTLRESLTPMSFWRSTFLADI
ncbi:hypothetical protein PAXINDRAFT_19798 [Paxillus involutus ATCC 200175]|uniref:G-protein coupled receptors family 1 profile domain-containing protein n=1 Tax=Paxillus involutus ATCC 200175 TaxID=664439 RepID=A0A0C9TI64_PAXIN|nr:hypothetical protein PAXINDRAFT_19798 [Paxillus involutus ATCC 200175]